MIIDIHSHIGDPWYAYWKKNVHVEDHLASMDKWGIDKRCVSRWQPHNALDEGNRIVASIVKKYPENHGRKRCKNTGIMKLIYPDVTRIEIS